MSLIHIRQLFENDWQTAKSIRLHALQQSPYMFASNYNK